MPYSVIFVIFQWIFVIFQWLLFLWCGTSKNWLEEPEMLQDALGSDDEALAQMDAQAVFCLKNKTVGNSCTQFFSETTVVWEDFSVDLIFK